MSYAEATREQIAADRLASAVERVLEGATGDTLHASSVRVSRELLGDLMVALKVFRVNQSETY